MPTTTNFVTKMVNRTDLINYLIRQRRLRRYLEITMHDRQLHFDHVDCPHKTTNYPYTADQFFATNYARYDLILIDGWHTEEQALKDIRQALACLAPGGIILIHDCMPPDAWHQREAEDYGEGENWNGTTWKAALRMFNDSPSRCSLLDMDWGCGVIDTSRTQVAAGRALPDALDYGTHYPFLLQYRVSPAVFLREQIALFYHLACIGNWREVFREQMEQLQHNGFYQLNLTVLGSQEDLEWAQALIEALRLRATLLFHSRDLEQFETPAMRSIEAYARHAEGYVLYLHSKGVSNPTHQPKIKWRRLMMRELVENWERCLQYLPDYDLVGVNWREMPPISHFCGNFWYAATSHIRRLSNFAQYYNYPKYRIWDAINDKRLGCEFWIGSAREKPRVLSLFCRNVDFCNDAYWYNK